MTTSCNHAPATEGMHAQHALCDVNSLHTFFFMMLESPSTALPPTADDRPMLPMTMQMRNNATAALASEASRAVGCDGAVSMDPNGTTDEQSITSSRQQCQHKSAISKFLAEENRRCPRSEVTGARCDDLDALSYHSAGSSSTRSRFGSSHRSRL